MLGKRVYKQRPEVSFDVGTNLLVEQVVRKNQWHELFIVLR